MPLLLLAWWSVLAVLARAADLDPLEGSLEEYGRCPFKGEDPCECTVKDHKYSVVCRFLDGDDLQRMMDQTRSANLTVHALFLYRSNVTLPKGDVFRSLSFSSVHLKESTVNPPPAKSSDSTLAILGGLEMFLQEVYLQQTTVPGLDATNCALGSLPGLRRLVLGQAGLTSIPDDFFCCSYVNLEDVYLYNNSIVSLKRGGLSRAQKLTVFNANSNLISVLDRQFFHDPAPQLREIHLRFNQIQTLPKDMFSAMPLLRLVDLSNNQITFLPDNTWSALWATLPDIYLDNNNISCDCSLDWVSRLEQGLSKKNRTQRFLTGQCISRSHSNVTTSPLDHLDVTDLASC